MGEENSNKFIDYYSSKQIRFKNIRQRLSLVARRKMYSRFVSWLEEEGISLTPSLKIIDVGVSPETALEDSNFFEEIYPHKSSLTVTSIEDASYLESKYPGITFIQTKPYSLPFPDRYFDVLFCNAVLEHVGNWQSQQVFLNELIRVSKYFCVITPNKCYPVDFHTGYLFLHWFPNVFRYILRKKNNILADEQYLNLLSLNDIKMIIGKSQVNQISGKFIHMFGLISNIMILGKNNLLE